MNRIITLTTDFGTGSPYVAQMKGVILSICPSATIVDVTHAVPPQDVRQGGLVLAEVAPRFPTGTIHVAVVDPGVGTERDIVCVCLAGHVFIGPDNGLFSLLARRYPPEAVFSVTERRYWLGEISSTFHGRDIMAPVAAHLAQGGAQPAQVGPPIERLGELDWPEPRVESQQIVGEVIAIDSFGNLITNVLGTTLQTLADGDSPAGLGSLLVRCGTCEVSGVCDAYGDKAESTPIALVGSSGLLELAIVGGSAADKLSAGVGAEVVVTAS